jgi:hypothetical protein
MDKGNVIKIIFFCLILIYVIGLYFVFKVSAEKECGMVRKAFDYCREQYNNHCTGDVLHSVLNPISPLNLSSFNITSEVQQNGS